MKEMLIGFMALVFGGKDKGDDWKPTKNDYFVFFGMIFFTITTVLILKLT